MAKTPKTRDRPTGAARSDAGGEAASRREQRRLLHQDLGRSQLLDAAEEVFGAKGFHDTTLKEIAELAEFSVGSVYSFFDNKEDLFLNVYLRRGAEFLPGMRQAVEAGASPLDELHALVDFEVGFFRLHPHFGRLYLRSTGSILPTAELPQSDVLTRNFELAMQIQADIFHRGQEAGQLRDGDPQVLGRLLTGLVAAYQSLDPAVVSEHPERAERLPLEALHDIIDGAFERR